MNTAKEENDYSIKSGMEEYEFVLGAESLLDATKYHEQQAFEIKNTKRVGIASVCALLKEKFILKGIYQNEEFDYSALKIASDHIVYKDIVSRNIIFCEGAKARFNAYFNHIPFIIAKGEYLVVNIPDLNQKFILNHHKILAPLINNDYWFGATFDWDLNTSMVTEEGKKELIESLEKIIKIPYQIKKHGGAYRPTIKDRRPVIGTHPIYHPLHVFNGFGTKAASLAPYYVTHFIQYLLGNIELEKEVNHRRF